MMQKRIVELFAGSRSIGKEGERQGCEVFSIDIEQFDGIDLVMDIEDLLPSMIPFIPDVIWASPPCTSYSVTAIYRHRKDGKTISNFAKKSDRLVKNTVKLAKHFGCIYYIENPRAYLRKMSFMQNLPRTTIWYCQYGMNYAKPTDIWSNNLRSGTNPFGWKPKAECFNGNENCHHIKQPRSYKERKRLGVLDGGVQGLKNNYERSKIPPQLCKEIISQTIKRLNVSKEEHYKAIAKLQAQRIKKLRA